MIEKKAVKWLITFNKLVWQPNFIKILVIKGQVSFLIFCFLHKNFLSTAKILEYIQVTSFCSESNIQKPLMSTYYFVKKNVDKGLKSL